MYSSVGHYHLLIALTSKSFLFSKLYSENSINVIFEWNLIPLMHQRRRSGIKNQNTINRRITTEKDNSDYLLGDFDVLNSNGMKLLRIISPQELFEILFFCIKI